MPPPHQHRVHEKRRRNEEQHNEPPAERDERLNRSVAGRACGKAENLADFPANRGIARRPLELVLCGNSAASQGFYGFHQNVHTGTPNLFAFQQGSNPVGFTAVFGCS